MLHLIGRRVTLSAPLLLVASLFTFVLEFLVPGDAAAVVLAGSNATPADLEAMRHRLGLDRPLWQQYADWLGQAARRRWRSAVSAMAASRRQTPRCPSVA